MKKHKLKYKIMIMEDKERYLTALKMKAKDTPFDFIHVHDRAELEKRFPEVCRQISGVILDIKDAQGETSSLLAARDYIKEFLHKESRDQIPIVALTAFSGEYESKKKDYAGTMEVFNKDSDEEKMFQYLIKDIEQSPRTKTIRKYSEVFEVVEKHMGLDSIDQLYKCFRDITSSDLPTIYGTLTNIRTLLEKIYIALYNDNNNIVPTKCILRKSPIKIDCGKFYKNLIGDRDHEKKKDRWKKTIEYDSIISREMFYVHKASSEGMHAIDDDTPIKPTKHTVQALTFALVDVLWWMKKAVKN